MAKPLLIAAAIGAVVYPAILGILSLTGTGVPIGIILCFIAMGAVAGPWLLLML